MPNADICGCQQSFAVSPRDFKKLAPSMNEVRRFGDRACCQSIQVLPVLACDVVTTGKEFSNFDLFAGTVDPFH